MSQIGQDVVCFLVGAAVVGAWWWWIGHRAKVKAMAATAEKDVKTVASKI